MRLLSGLVAAIIAGLVGFVMMIGTGVVWIVSLLLGMMMVACFGASLFIFAGCFLFPGPAKYLTALGFLGYSAAAFVSITVLHYGMDALKAPRLPKGRPVSQIDMERIGGMRLARDVDFE